MDFITQIDQKTFKLALWVQPGAKKNSIEGVYQNCLKVKICAPPVDNKANKEVVEFMSKIFKVKKSQIKIVGGQKNRKKLLLISLENDMDPKTVLKTFLN
ncbi:DUF167 domain-containing protein [Desulfothermus okinawensis JCM 13304]